MKKETVINIIKIIFAAAVVILTALNYNSLVNLDIRMLIANASGLLAAELIILGVYLLKSVTLVVPASVIYISVGMALDHRQAVVINLLGIALEVTATYIMGKFLGRDAVEKRLSGTKYGDKLLNMQNKSQSTAAFAIRFIPAFPIDFSSLFMGAFGFKFPQYLIFSVLGIAPRVIAFTLLGDGIYEFIPMKYVLIAVMVIVPAAVIAAIIKSQINKRKNR